MRTEVNSATAVTDSGPKQNFPKTRKAAMFKGESDYQMSESFLVCAILATTGGFLDVYTYITRSQVFANAQTGNIVLLGLELAEGHIENALCYLAPILAFAAGILFTEIIRYLFKEFNLLHWRQIVVLLEALLLLLPAAIPSGRWDILVNILISFACAVQVESFRKVHGHAVATTMCTGNLRSATEQLFRYLKTGDPSIRSGIISYYTVILFFIVGAAAGAGITFFLAEKAILCCSGLLAASFAIMFFNKSRTQEQSAGSPPDA